MSSATPQNPDDYCYRHPDRRSYVLCQRCLRTVCPECQTPAAVGVVCPACMKAQQQATPPRVKRAQAAVRRLDSRPMVTLWIVGLTVAAWLLDLIPQLGVQNALLFNPGFLDPANGPFFQPWRALTVLLTHGSIFHLGLNMLAVWMLGRTLEPLLGRARFLALYLLAGLGGSVGVALIAPGTWVVGASGAVFGLLGAYLVIGRSLGANMTGIIVILGINLVMGFLPGFTVAWQAHVGGLLVGLLIGLIFARTRKADRQRAQIGLLVGTGVALAALAALAVFIH